MQLFLFIPLPPTPTPPQGPKSLRELHGLFCGFKPFITLCCCFCGERQKQTLSIRRQCSSACFCIRLSPSNEAFSSRLGKELIKCQFNRLTNFALSGENAAFNSAFS